MQDNIVLKIADVTKIINKKKIIDNLNLDIKKGEVFGLLGPNGAGKTTIIRMIVGLISITNGDIRINEKSIKTQYEEAINNVGAIVESPDVYKYLSGYKNLKIFGRMYNHVTDEHIKDAVKLVGLENRINDKVKTYSLGMRQRLGIALAMLNTPKVLILDEPTNGLDPEGIHEMRNYLRKLASERGVTVIVSSHLLSEMELMCDRFAIINSGKLVNISSMQEKNISNVTSYFFETGGMEDTKKAIRLLSLKGIKFDSGENGLYISIQRNEIPALYSSLYSEGINIYAVVPQKNSLEQYYLNVVGGNRV